MLGVINCISKTVHCIVYYKWHTLINEETVFRVKKPSHIRCYSCMCESDAETVRARDLGWTIQTTVRCMTLGMIISFNLGRNQTPTGLAKLLARRPRLVLSGRFGSHHPRSPARALRC